MSEEQLKCKMVRATDLTIGNLIWYMGENVIGMVVPSGNHLRCYGLHSGELFDIPEERYVALVLDNRLSKDIISFSLDEEDAINEIAEELFASQIRVKE